MDEIDSPCIDICTIDRDSGECIGCGRTVEEVRNWANFDNLKKTNFREFKCNKNTMYKIKIV
tara:strand:- start:20 stop:205 length:186 start_codon:yes stop_codon:yes gene_type:complete